MPSPFVWYELMTTDPEAAEAFYKDVVGWTGRDSGMPDMRYTILAATTGRDVAGIMPLPEPVAASGGRPGWTGYIHVDDVDRAAEALQAAGGHVHRAASDIPGIGRFAVVSDPQGAVFELFKPAGAPPDPSAMPGPMTPGHVGWHELHAADGASADAFYRARFGWTEAGSMDMGPMGQYRMFATGGPPAQGHGSDPAAIGGIMTKRPEQPHPAWLFYFTVPALDAAIDRAKAGGGQVLNGPMEVPGGSWIAQFLDPQGAMFALVAADR